MVGAGPHRHGIEFVLSCCRLERSAAGNIPPGKGGEFFKLAKTN